MLKRRTARIRSTAYILRGWRKDMAMNTTITLLPIVVVFTILCALPWHNQPARNPDENPPGDKQAPPKQEGKT